jgi:hypothetical protein
MALVIKIRDITYVRMLVVAGAFFSGALISWGAMYAIQKEIQKNCNKKVE